MKAIITFEDTPKGIKTTIVGVPNGITDEPAMSLSGMLAGQIAIYTRTNLMRGGGLAVSGYIREWSDSLLK